VPSEDPYEEISGLELGTVEFNAELCDQRCQLFIVEPVGAEQLGVFALADTQNQAKGADVVDLKERRRDGTQQIAIKGFQDEVIGMRRRTHHGLVGSGAGAIFIMVNRA
jgi:hypothetical protein